MKKVVRNNGITLIALVITIIVLLILAGITINSVVGDNGIMRNTQKASDSTKKAQSEEIRKSNALGKYIENYSLDIKYGDATVGDDSYGTLDRLDIVAIENYISYKNEGEIQEIPGETIEETKAKIEEHEDEIKRNSDLNLDGEVSQDDVIILALYLAYPDKIQLPYLEELPLFGDLNLDGKIDQADSDLYYEYWQDDYEGIPNDKVRFNADIYLDGSLSQKDQTLLKQYIAGNRESLPVIPHPDP